MMIRTVLAAALGASLLATSAYAQMKEFKYSSWTPPPAPNNRFGTVPMFAAIEKELKGTKDEIVFKNFMGAQLFNAATTLAGVRDGVVDAGVTVPVYNAGELKGHVTLAELQAALRDGYSAAAANTETLLLDCPQCLADYAKNNALILGVYSTSPYHMMCSFDVKSMDDLRGKKTASASPVFARFAHVLGMTRIALPPSELLQAMQRGTTDCMFGAKDWLNAFSLKDVVKTVIEDITLGTVPAVSMLTVNKNSWAKLSPRQREAFLRHMPDAIMRVTHGYYSDEKRGEDDARAKGAKFVKIGPAFAKAWTDFAATEEATVTAGAKQRGVADAEKLIKTHLANIEKWKGIVDKIGPDPAKLTAELQTRVFAKVKF
jgi:TRAP-type C4-dicarboxylate transport system substrate-binding protein